MKKIEQLYHITFKILLINFLIISGFSLSSCSSMEEPMNPSNNDKTLSEDDFIEVPFEIPLINENNTRNSDLTSSDNIGPDGIPKHYDSISGTALYIGIYYENLNNPLTDNINLLVSFWDHEIRNTGELSNYNGYITDFKFDNNKIILNTRFSKYLDPSKIIILCTNLNIYDNNDNFYQSANLNYCHFYKLHRINTINSWDNIDTTISMERIECEIYILTSSFINRPYTTWVNISLNAYPIVNNLFMFNPNSWAGSIYIFNWIRPYYFRIDKNTFNESTEARASTSPTNNEYEYNNGDYTLIYQGESNLSLSNRNYNVSYNNCKLNYKGKSYYYLMPFNIMATKDKSYPKYSNNEWDNCPADGYPLKNKDLKYIITYQANSNDKNVKWGYLDLPSGGIQSNKRYIYIVEDSNNLFNNSIDVSGGFNTKSNLNETIPCTNYELIEQDMDEPFPFEFVNLADSE